jgi:hypothetical protein
MKKSPTGQESPWSACSHYNHEVSILERGLFCRGGDGAEWSGDPWVQSISRKRPSRFVIPSLLSGRALSAAKDLCPARDPSLRMTLLNRLRLTRKTSSLNCIDPCRDISGQGNDGHSLLADGRLHGNLQDTWHLSRGRNQLAVGAAFLKQSFGMGLLKVQRADFVTWNLRRQRQHREGASPRESIQPGPEKSACGRWHRLSHRFLHGALSWSDARKGGRP